MAAGGGATSGGCKRMGSGACYEFFGKGSLGVSDAGGVDGGVSCGMSAKGGTLVLVDESESRVCVDWAWKDTVGKVRERICAKLRPGCVVNEHEMLKTPYKEVYGENFKGSGPPDDAYVMDVFLDELMTLQAATPRESRHQPPRLENVELFMDTYVPLDVLPCSTVILFPGQGTQRVGMLDPLLTSPHNTTIVQNLFARASEILGYDLYHVCQEGPEALLHSTRVSQPAVMVAGLAAIAIARETRPELGPATVAAVAGFSLGEYTALVFSGAISFEEGVKLVQTRGEAMQQAADAHQGGMVTVVGLDDTAIDSLCADSCAFSPDTKPLVIANRLFPNGRVLSGHIDACKWAEGEAKNRGAVTARLLLVSGAFHSQQMRPAVLPLVTFLSKCEFKEPGCPVYSNVTGDLYTDVKQIKHLLADQVCSPVEWERIIASVSSQSPEAVVEAGPGQQLRAMVKRSHPHIFDVMECLM